MKITVTFSPLETDRAAAVILALTRMFQFKTRSTPERDGYFHTYLSIREPFPVVEEMPESTDKPCSDDEIMV